MASQSQNIQDETMQVEQRNPTEEEVEDTKLQDNESRIRVLGGSTNTAASFEFLHEDHTLGNALRYIITKNPVVELCAYSIPHPSEPKMNLRIQTFPNQNDNHVYDVLRKGLTDLQDLCDVVTDKFTVARDGFMDAQPTA